MSLDDVRDHAEQLRRDSFPSLGATYVPGEGGMARVMIVGDRPTAQSATAGRPFAGHEGVVLRQLIGLANLEYGDCWFTQLVKFRTPFNRLPNHSEAQAFRLVLKAEWICVGRPKLIVALGAAAYMAVAGARPSGYGKYKTVTAHTKIVLLHPPVLGVMRAELREEIEWEWKSLLVP